MPTIIPANPLDWGKHKNGLESPLTVPWLCEFSTAENSSLSLANIPLCPRNLRWVTYRLKDDCVQMNRNDNLLHGLYWTVNEELQPEAPSSAFSSQTLPGWTSSPNRSLWQLPNMVVTMYSALLLIFSFHVTVLSSPALKRGRRWHVWEQEFRLTFSMFWK